MSSTSKKLHFLIASERAPDFVWSLESKGASWVLCDQPSILENCLKQRLKGQAFAGLILNSPCSDSDLRALRSQPILKRTPILLFENQGWSLHASDQADQRTLTLMLAISRDRDTKIPSSQKLVLIVDDVAVNRKLMGGYLRQLGHEALFASDGDEALTLLEQTSPDLILMDVEMPGKTGLETTFELRRSELEARECPVLAVTGHSGPRERELCLTAGMDEVLVKPITKASLSAAVKHWASRKISHQLPTLTDRRLASPPVSLEQLHADVGFDHKLLASAISSFLNDVEQAFPEIEKAIAEEDFSTISQWAHSVQGAASYFGAKRLEKLAQSLEVLGPDSSASLLKGVYNSFLKEWEQVKSYLEQSQLRTGPTEIEILVPLNLEPEQLNLIDLHSFLNIMNVVAAELQNLEDEVTDRSDLQGCLDVLDDFSQRLRQPSEVELALKNFPEFQESFFACLDSLRPKDTIQSLSIYAASKDNLSSIFQVMKRRCRDLLDRLHQPDRWEAHSIEGLLNNTKQMLAAVEKNAKGRYHIVYNIAAQEANDYLVHLDIKSIDGETVKMPAVFVDILRDLIANARKYTEPGGTIQAGLIDDGQYLRLAVEDNGRGIPRHEIPKVVGFGYRASNVADRPTMGAGFGLTKAFWATKHFEGRMWIRSEVEQGTRVTIQLPSQGRQKDDSKSPATP